jgi:hypothetical protein
MKLTPDAEIVKRDDKYVLRTERVISASEADVLVREELHRRAVFAWHREEFEVGML